MFGFCFAYFLDIFYEKISRNIDVVDVAVRNSDKIITFTNRHSDLVISRHSSIDGKPGQSINGIDAIRQKHPILIVLAQLTSRQGYGSVVGRDQEVEVAGGVLQLGVQRVVRGVEVHAGEDEGKLKGEKSEGLECQSYFGAVGRR